MIILEGLFRQSAEVTIKEKPMLKLVVEHETERPGGASDLHLETLFLDRQEAARLPKAGERIMVAVRPYPSGRGVAYAATSIVLPALSPVQAEA